VEIHDPDRNLDFSVVYRYEENRAYVTTGGETDTVKLKQNEYLYMDSGAFFTVFFRLCRLSNRSCRTTIYDLTHGRTAGIELTITGEESIDVNGEERDTEIMEMRMTGLASVFWPHVYTYWYCCETGELLQYEGVNPDQKPYHIFRLPDQG
jgi:hypothetical protein